MRHPDPATGWRRLTRRRLTRTVAGLCVAAWIVLAGALLDSGAVDASIGTSPEGAFSITPARRYATASPPIRLQATRVANTTAATLQVQVFPVRLGQLPWGAFTFSLFPPALSAAGRVLGVAPRSFSLPPGSSREVALLWRGLPAHTRIANTGVVYQAISAQGPSQVRVIERLLGVNLLRLPGRYTLTGALVGARVTQIKPGVLRFLLSVRNTGQAAVGPSRLVLTIRDHNGALRVSRELTGDIVLPGATRDFVVDVAQPLPAGSYTMRGHMAFGSSHRLSTMRSFALVGPNDLPSWRLAVGPLSAQGTIGEGAQVSAALETTGTAAGTTTVALDLYRLTDGIPGQAPTASRHVTLDLLAPGRSSHLEADLGRLRRGTYRLVASYEDSEGTTKTLVADFQAQQPLGLLARLRSLSNEHALLIPFLLILLNAATVVLLLRERRVRRTHTTTRQQLEHEGP